MVHGPYHPMVYIHGQASIWVYPYLFGKRLTDADASAQRSAGSERKGIPAFRIKTGHNNNKKKEKKTECYAVPSGISHVPKTLAGLEVRAGPASAPAGILPAITGISPHHTAI